MYVCVFIMIKNAVVMRSKRKLMKVFMKYLFLNYVLRSMKMKDEVKRLEEKIK
jgi:transcription antitermination factor NusG